MKKVRVLSLVLCLMLLLGTFATAAGTVSVDGKILENDDAVLTVQENVDATLDFWKNPQGEANEDKISVTVNSNALVVGEQVLVLMAKCDSNGEPMVSDGNIYFIDQKEVENTGTITFDVYPSSMSDSVIFIVSEETGKINAVLVDGKIALGDVNEDKVVDIADVGLLLQYVVALVDETGLNVDVANCDRLGEIDIADVGKLLRVVVKLEEM